MRRRASKDASREVTSRSASDWLSRLAGIASMQRRASRRMRLDLARFTAGSKSLNAGSRVSELEPMAEPC
jgi:hypothetical protein